MAPPFTKPYIESTTKRVRVFFGGKFLVDTTNAKLSSKWLKQYYPTYFFEAADAPTDYLFESFKSDEHQGYDVVVGKMKAEGAAKVYLAGELKGLMEIQFSSMHAWFEEDEQIFVHPKDPYKRVDVLQSSRHVRVEIDGVEVANTTKPRLLFETGLAVRTYIPKTDCKLEMFVPSQLTTQCPYKGIASYYSVRLPTGEAAENVVWWYRTPQLECADIKGFVAFYDEKVDVWVDGVRQARPGGA